MGGAYPVCGQCGSRSVYPDRDEIGRRVIGCLMCGNRQPGAGKGFYMSDKVDLKDLKTTIEEGATMEDRHLEGREVKVEPPVKLCEVCKTKPTISKGSTYCASCMAKKSNQRRTTGKPTCKTKRKEMKEDKGATVKSSPRANMAVAVDFSRYPFIFDQITELALDQVRPVDAQIIFLLKTHFETNKPDLKSV